MLPAGGHLLIEFEDFDDVGLLVIALTALVPGTITTFSFVLLSEKVVLRLISFLASTIFIPLFLMPARDAIFIDSSDWQVCFDSFIVRICHDHFHSLQVFSRGAHSLHKLQVLPLHILVPLE